MLRERSLIYLPVEVLKSNYFFCLHHSCIAIQSKLGLSVCIENWFYIVVTGDAQFLEDESTKIFARKVADHYSARTNQTLEERENSPIIHLKKLNNWVCLAIS